MQYFVSIENTSYFYWQIELLIESFRMLGLEDSLLIGIAQEGSPKVARFTKNIISHKKKFIHKNFGREVGYLPLNKPYSIALAMENNVLQSPFVVIHPDMLLQSPIQDLTSDPEKIIFQTGADDPTTMEKLKPYVEELAKVSNQKPEAFPTQFPLGATMYFQDVAKDFFYRVLRRMEWLVRQNGSVEWNMAKLSWLLTMYEHLDKYPCKGVMFERRLVDNEPLTPLIHYKFGLPPAFNKKFFTYENIRMGGDPYAILLQYSPNTAVDFSQKVIRSYNGSKPTASPNMITETIFMS